MATISGQATLATRFTLAARAGRRVRGSAALSLSVAAYVTASSLESLVVALLRADAQLVARLATFAGIPAVFVGDAPGDVSAGWAGARYPRVVVSASWTALPDRRAAGTLLVEVYGSEDANSGPNVVEQVRRAVERVERVLNGAVVHPTALPPVGLRWTTRTTFSEPDAEPNLTGTEVAFDLVALSSHVTTVEPDPLAALDAYARERWAGLGLQVSPRTWAPSASEPALYWRAVRSELTRRTAAMQWWQITVAAHVLAADVTNRLAWLTRVSRQLVDDMGVKLADGSWLQVEIPVVTETEADPLRSGQLAFRGHYRVLATQPAAEPLETIVGELPALDVDTGEPLEVLRVEAV